MTLKNKRGNTFEQKTLYYASNMHEPSQIFSLKNEGFDSRIYANGNSNGEGLFLIFHIISIYILLYFFFFF